MEALHRPLVRISGYFEGLIGLTTEELAAEVKKQRPGKQGLSVA